MSLRHTLSRLRMRLSRTPVPGNTPVITGIGDEQDEVKVVSGSSGALMRISERGGVNVGRQSWRQQR